MNIKPKILEQFGNYSFIHWKQSHQDKIDWATQFKNIFILQRKDDISLVFNVDEFGLHNGFTLTEYCNHEFEEFELKIQRFGLQLNCTIQCFDIGEDYFYLCLGKKTEKSLFEAIFKWDDNTKKAVGNGLPFKIEPKTQFSITVDKSGHENNADDIIVGKDVLINRRINLSPINPKDTIKTAILGSDVDNIKFEKHEHEEHLGGTFYSLAFTLDNEHYHTYWETLTVFSNVANRKTSKTPVLMRGIDHPMFLDNLFPIVRNNTISCPKITDNLFLLYVQLKNGKEFFYKYPKETFFEFNSEIAQASITDTLSFDWIVHVK